MKLKFISMMAALALAGCVSTTEKTVEKDIAQQPEKTTGDAAQSGRDAIANSNKLSSTQKQKMLALMDQTQADVALIRKDEAQVKSSLFKYLATGKYEDHEIAVYRKQLEKLEDKKMSLMFSSLKETRKILGKDVEVSPDFMNLYHLNLDRY